MCQLLVSLRPSTARSPSIISVKLSEKSSQQSSLGLSVQLCTLAMVARRSCAVGQWSSEIKSMDDDWTRLIRRLKAGMDAAIRNEDAAALSLSPPP